MIGGRFTMRRIATVRPRDGVSWNSVWRALCALPSVNLRTCADGSIIVLRIEAAR